ncbi:MAG: metalloregulator ArsR/SmtB family transcription factor [Gemmataceae bacterium]|nr:metalloregulator ArsR/SmtB family transcription factor [Gemmataceae bacterium]
MSTTSPTLTKPRSTKRPSRTDAALKVSPETLEDLADLFKQLGDPSRLKILLALAENGEMHVSALHKLLDQSQPAVSHHLNLLRVRHLVGFRRDGRHNYYRIDSARIRLLLEQFFNSTGNGHKQLQFDDFALAFKPK